MTTIGIQAGDRVLNLDVVLGTAVLNNAFTATAVAQTSGAGSLTTGTYYYKIVGLDASNNPLFASSEVSVVLSGSQNAVLLSWPTVDGLPIASSYRIYRGTSSGSENTYYSTTGLEFPDVGASGTSGTPFGTGNFTIKAAGNSYVISPLAITDTSAHYTLPSSLSVVPQRTVLVYSTLNQSVTLQLYGSVDNQVSSGAFSNGYTITGGTNQVANATVAATSNWTIPFTLTDAHLYIQGAVTAGTAPTSGGIVVLVLSG